MREVERREWELQRENARLLTMNDCLTALYYDLEFRQDAFAAAPLWRRLWIAIRPRRYFTDGEDL